MLTELQLVGESKLTVAIALELALFFDDDTDPDVCDTYLYVALTVSLSALGLFIRVYAVAVV